MSEEVKKEEIVYNAPVIEFDNTKSVITNIGFDKGAKVKFQIVFPIPLTDEEAKARYDCLLADLIAAGVRQLTTRVDYKTVGFYNIGDIAPDGTKIEKVDHPSYGQLKPEGHEAMQSLADAYKVGRTPDPEKAANKAKLAEAKNLESEFGNLAELAKRLKELKEQGLIS